MDFGLSSPTAVTGGGLVSSAGQPPGLDHRAMETIRSLDSRSFGFLDFHLSNRINRDNSTNNNVDTSYITKDFIRQGIAKLQEDLRTGPQSDTFQSNIYCHLGHLHLLLEEYHEALSAYQRYQQLSPLESSTNTSVTYGLGLIYFNMNSYKWAIDCFSKVLSQSSSFARAGEIHLRLGVMFKTKGEYLLSMDHFQKALTITGPASFSRLETQFHIGHLCCLQGQCSQAREVFEGILATKSVPNSIRAMTLRQLGWLYHTVPTIAGPGEDPNTKATDLLKLAVGADAVSPQAWYFLGRCHAMQGRAREAFLAYQQAISKAVDDDQADIWCSIGILYHSMGQPKDSLQAYLCALYLDPNSLACWTDLGCLYEAVSQPLDALLCYKNGVSYFQKTPSKGKCPEFVFSRVANLEQYLSVAGPSLLRQPRSLPSLMEAWHSLIPSHIKQRKSHTELPLLQLPSLSPSMSPSLPLPHDFSSVAGSSGGGLPFSLGLSPSPTQSHAHLGLPPPSKKFKGRTNKNKDPIIIKNMQDSWVVPGVATAGQQVPSFSQFSPTNLQSVPQPSPIPGFISPMFGMRNENANLLGSDMGGRNGIGMGFAPPGEDICTDSPNSSDFDAGHSLPNRGAASMRLRSSSSSGTSVNGSIQDINLSGSHSSGNGNILGGEPFQSHLNDTIDNSPFIAAGSSAASMASSSVPMLPLKATPTASSSGYAHLLNNNVAATSLIAKPPSILNDHRDLHHHHTHYPSPSASISVGSPNPSILLAASGSVHHVETLPNSSYNNTASPDCYNMQPHPFLSPQQPYQPPGGVSGAPLSGQPGGNFSHNLMGSSSYHFSSQPQQQQQHAHDNFPPLAVPSAPGSSSVSFPASYPQTNHQHHQLLLGDSFSSKTSVPPQLPPPPPPPPPPHAAPVNHVDNELAQVDKYMQQYLSESHSHESLKNGAILNATKEHDSLISQVLLMSPNRHDGFDQRRSSGATTAMFLSTLDETRKNGRGSPFSPRSAEALRLLASRGGSLDDFATAASSSVDNGVGLCSPLQRRTSSATPSGDSVGLRPPLQRLTSSGSASGDSVAARSPLQRRASSASDKVGSCSPLERCASLTSRHGSSTSPPNSEANMLLSSSQSRDTIDHQSHISEANSDTSSSGVSSAGTKFSNSMASSSDQSSPIGSTNSPAVFLSPLTTPSPTPHSGSKDNFTYPPSVGSSSSSSGDRRASQGSYSGQCDLLDQIYEPYPALSDNEGEYMIENPDLRPPPPPKIKGKIDLHPEVPIFEVNSKEEAISENLHALCCAHDVPICIVRGLADVLDLNLELFSSDSLTKTYGEQEIEVRIQVQQAADENTDPSGRKQIWRCESSRSKTTIQEYAEYQKTFSKDEVVESDMFKNSDSAVDKSQRRSLRKSLEFGTNVDLSDSKVWSTQLQELNKLPKFLRVDCPEGNFLSHIGHTILGMNSVQLYMKVPGARTPGHQENNNFCSVNINIGPGDCEWFAVHNKYWGVFHRLCEKHKISFLIGSWWPILDELRNLKVPVYRFTQYKGDLVWLNPGTVHWVQANRVCNNIAWNAGPLTAHQFRMSWERYRWNKIQRVRSIVPMIHLTWNLARTIRIINQTLYEQLKSLLESSLTQCKRLLTHLKKAGIPIVWHGRVDDEPAPCCNNCLEEVFNVLFVLTHKGEYLVYCHRCATAMRKSFTVLQQYHLEELESILSSFKLHQPRQIHST